MNAIAQPRPVIVQLSGARLKAALIAGCRRVLSRRDYLNRINVFPVPDGDTGTNLAFTLAAVMKAARRLRGGDVASVFARVAHDAVDGARGNSGAIFAQFFQGMADALRGQTEAGTGTIALATQSAARSARACMAEPRDGTILSVIHDFAEEFRAQSDRGIGDLGAAFRPALERARVSLANTPRQLPVLRAAGVVDAGAAGFVDFLEGVQDYLDHGREALRPSPGMRDLVGDELSGDVHLESVETASRYRYCSECVVAGHAIDAAAVRAALAALPLDSLVVAGGSERVRVHAHIDAPNHLFDALTVFGTVSQRKADDMQAQARLRAAPFQSVRVVCDSAADLPAGEAERLGIGIVPVRVNFGDEDFMDRVTLSPRELYARLRRDPTPPQTSQPPPGDFRRAYELLLGHCDRVVSISVSGGISGTFQAAQGAARDTAADRIDVIDTSNVSAGQALIAMRAAERAAAGGDAKAVVAAAHSAMTNTLTFAMIRDLRYGVAGGRLPAIVKRIADLFGLTLLVTARGGKVKPFRPLAGGRNLPERFAGVVARKARGAARWRAIVGHCDAPDDAAALAAALRERIAGLHTVWVTETGPAIGAHAGPGSLVVGLQPDDEPA
jgi:DegV family protein with EDD domain